MLQASWLEKKSFIHSGGKPPIFDVFGFLVRQRFGNLADAVGASRLLHTLVNMSKPNSLPGDDRKELIAARIVAVSEGLVKVPAAMRLVGFPSPLNDSVRKRVDHKSKNIKDDGSITLAASPCAVLTAKAQPASAEASKISSLTKSGSLITSNVSTIQAAHSASMSDRPTPNTLVEARRNLEQSLDTVPKPPARKPPAKKRRRTSKQKQDDDAEIAKRKKVESQGTKMATLRIQENSLLTPTKRKSHSTICSEVNALVGSNVHPNTAGRLVRDGRAGFSPQKRDPNFLLPNPMWDVLQKAFITFIKLEQAASKTQSTSPELLLKVNTLVRAGGYKRTGTDRYIMRRLREETADEIDVAKKNIVEQRQLIWTTYSNLSLWFDTFEGICIKLGFGQKPDEEDRRNGVVVEGSVEIYQGQLHGEAKSSTGCSGVDRRKRRGSHGAEQGQVQQ